MMYDEAFFDWVDAGSLQSADIVVPIILDLCSATSAVDVGCGRGAWLRAFVAAGITDVLGIDARVADGARLYIPRDQYSQQDLVCASRLDRHYDIALCLEVAEHLPSEAGPALVNFLCGSADVVFFAAAIPGQGGVGHINERPFEYWRALFADAGYAAFDCVRPRIHANAAVAPWFRYNGLLYANARGESRLTPAARSSRVSPAAALRDFGSAAWRLRCAVLRHLTPEVVSVLSRLRFRLRTIARAQG